MEITEIQRKTSLLYEETDKIIKTLPSCCKKGCSFCCYQNIRVVSSEEFTITSYLDSYVKSETKTIIKEQLIAWLSYFNNKTPNKILDENDLMLFEVEIAKDKVSCPFLVNSECSIYPVRPLVCRTHIVESEPEKCNINRRRDSNIIAKNLRDQKAIELLKSAPMNGIRLLAYSIKEYFEVKTNTKPVLVQLLNPKR